MRDGDYDRGSSYTLAIVAKVLSCSTSSSVTQSDKDLVMQKLEEKKFTTGRRGTSMKRPQFIFFFKFSWVWYDPHLTYFWWLSKVKLFLRGCEHQGAWLCGRNLSKKVRPWNITRSRSIQGQPNPKNKHLILFLWPLHGKIGYHPTQYS